MIPSTCNNDQETSTVTKDSAFIKPNIKGEWLNLIILTLLYIMQGVPLGIASVLPIILQSNKYITYKDQTLISLVEWPFSLKLFWAPFVDSLYIPKIGRRKSWLIPTQLLIGISLLYVAINIDEMIPETGKPNVVKLVIVFFSVVMLAATQDIVVDGWALTMLKKNNVGYASTCNLTGQTLGVMIGSVGTVLLTSEKFSNKFLRFTPATGGVITLRDLFLSCGISFIFITLLIAIFKKENYEKSENYHDKLNIFQNYIILLDIMKLPSIQILAVALLTSKIGFAATDGVSILKLIDEGIPKENISIIHLCMYLIKTIIPLIVVMYTSGTKPMNIYLNMIPIRLLFNLAFVALIYYTPNFIKTNEVINIPVYYYVILVLIVSIYEILHNIMTVAIIAFFSRISDPRIGGTYMTLLNSLTNIAGAWTNTSAIGMIQLLTFKECSINSNNNCSTSDLQNICEANAGNCNMTVNGYYIEMAVCTFIGIVWYSIFKDTIKNLQNKSWSHWLVNLKLPTKENIKNIYTTNIKL